MIRRRRVSTYNVKCAIASAMLGASLLASVVYLDRRSSVQESPDRSLDVSLRAFERVLEAVEWVHILYK